MSISLAPAYAPDRLRRFQAAVLAAALLWGTIGVAGKALYGLGEVSALNLGLFRLGIAAPLLGMLNLRLDRGVPWRFHRRELPWWALTVLSMAAYQVFLFSAVQRTAVTTAIFLAICTAPVLVALAAPLAIGESFSSRILWAGALALAGATLVMGVGNPGHLMRADYLLGNLLALGAAACWATYAIVARRLVQSHSVTRVTFITFAGAAALLAPLVLFEAQPVVLPASGWMLALYLGAIPTALAYYLYVSGLRAVTATASAFLALAEPGAAALLSALFFHERLTLAGWLGVLCLLAGLLVLTRQR